MTGPLSVTLLVLLWGTALVRVPTLWRDAQQRAMWATIALLALVKTVALPGVNDWLGTWIPHPEKSPQLLGVAAGFFLLRFILLINGEKARWEQVVLPVAVIIVLVPLPGTHPAYWVVLNGYVVSVLTISGAIVWRVSRPAPPGLLRLGLRAIAVGVLIIASYGVVKTSLIVAHGLGIPVTFDPIQPQADAIRALGTILAVGGAAVPATSRLRTVVGEYRSLWALRPLWRVMRRTFPEVILFSRRRALVELSGVEAVQLRVYRRVIEIRDGMLTLRDYLPADGLHSAAAFLGAQATPALVEACGIALALERHRHGSQALETGARWTDTSTAGELGEEIAWLSAVSAAYRDNRPAQFTRAASA
ncbi:MAB_1171c family putative transporter [Winogradskya humida]|uniref:DUF6545 domain-containing protein n=1 Tax=Winogradskya humida TaxID=113566 RepID=A0ABQ3ZLD5_9ACTN|nr:MAB_1171c family putative transporter [Actinoplanes humidus]GIE19398.1 hypothetical protein Ahu01nite_025000 [Actinoplanes humidus]